MAIDDEDDLRREEVERRKEPRGLFRGISVEVKGFAGAHEALEASRRGFFVKVDDPERFHLGEVYETTITAGADAVRCRMEVIRKEIDPRRGVALRINFIDPPNEELLKKILGPAA
jgi:hypothetical protein